MVILLIKVLTKKISSSSSAHRPELIDAVLDAQQKALQEANRIAAEENLLKEQEAGASENNKKGRGRPRVVKAHADLRSVPGNPLQ
jgi:hypothetical protein